MTKPFKLIGLTGTAGSGKSAAAQFLCDVYAMRQISLAEPIRDGIVAMFGIDHNLLTDRALKEQPIAHLCNKSPRQMMQTLGTEWGRNSLCPHIWLNIAQRKIDYNRKLAEVNTNFLDGIVISDIRFEGEAKWLRDQGGEIWSIIRPDNPYAIESTHESETGIDHGSSERVIYNVGTLDELYEKIALIMEIGDTVEIKEKEHAV